MTKKQFTSLSRKDSGSFLKEVYAKLKEYTAQTIGEYLPVVRPVKVGHEWCYAISFSELHKLDLTGFVVVKTRSGDEHVSRIAEAMDYEETTVLFDVDEERREVIFLAGQRFWDDSKVNARLQRGSYIPGIDVQMTKQMLIIKEMIAEDSRINI